MAKVTLIPLVKGAEALPKTAELISTTETSITVEYNEMYNGALLTHTTTIPRSAVAFTMLKPTANNDAPPVSKLVAPAPVVAPAKPAAPAPVAPAPAPVVEAAAAPAPVDGPKKRGPKPKPRDANGNIIRETTPTLAPPATTPTPPARPGAEIKKKRPVVVADPEPEFVPEEAAPAPRPKAEKAKPVSKYRPTLAPVEPEDDDDGVDLDDADLADVDADVDDVAEVETDEDPEFDF